jgi:hypothetical protein
MILHETFPLALARPSAPGGEAPSVRLSARPLVLRLRRELEPCGSDRRWLLEVEVEVPAIDPERVLAECEDFLVDGRDGRQIGVVDRVERSGAAGGASALVVSAGWFGRRRLRVDAQAVEALVPEERRMIVDESRVHPLGRDRRTS